MKFPRLLVKAPNWIGDAVMASPFVAAVRAHWPRAHIAIMARSRIRPVAERIPGIGAVVDEPTRSPFRLAAILKAGEYDIAFTLASSLSISAAFRLARIPVRIGFSGGGRGPFLTVAVRPLDRSVHQVDHYLALARAAGVPTPASSVPGWKVFPEDRREAVEFLKASGVAAGSSLGAFAPGASYGPAKRWLRARWAELGDRLCLGNGLKVVIVGGKDEIEAAQSIAALMARPPILAVGALSLGGTAALLARSRVFVSNDSGLMHVGAAVGAPTLGLFGSSNPHWTGPVGAKVGSVWGHVPCSPCYRRTCFPGRRYACQNALTVDRVLDSLPVPALRSSFRP
jgi:heptosyltransferase-2